MCTKQNWGKGRASFPWIVEIKGKRFRNLFALILPLNTCACQILCSTELSSKSMYVIYLSSFWKKPPKRSDNCVKESLLKRSSLSPAGPSETEQVSWVWQAQNLNKANEIPLIPWQTRGNAADTVLDGTQGTAHIFSCSFASESLTNADYHSDATIQWLFQAKIAWAMAIASLV